MKQKNTQIYMIMFRSVHSKSTHENGTDQKPFFFQRQTSANTSVTLLVVFVWTCSYG